MNIMNADFLPIPLGVLHAIKVNGVREICSYVVNKDTFMARWDTVVDGVKYTVKKYKPDTYDRPLNAEQFAESERADSIERLSRLIDDKLIVELEINPFY